MAQSIPPRPSAAEPALLGVDLGSNHIRLGIVLTHEAKTSNFRREPYAQAARTDARALAEQLRAVIRQMLEEHPEVAAVGVAFPTLVEQTRQRVAPGAGLPSLSGIDLQGELAEACGRPVRFEYNARAAACAEMRGGVARGIDDWLYLHIGANVGAGLVLGGQLQRGRSGLAGALGLLHVDPERSGDAVQLEEVASAENIVRRTRERLKRDRTSSLSRLGAMGGFNYDDIITAAHGGDELAKIMLQRTGIFLGIALADVISLLNLSLIAVGGAPAARNFLVPAIAAEVRQRTSPAAFADCTIVAAEIGAEAGVIGAALLAGA